MNHPDMNSIPPSPRQIHVDITTRCNLKCRYCYHFNSPGAVAEDLSADEWCRFFEECRENNVLQLMFAGGEPFLRPDMPELLACAKRNRLRYDFASNGVLITPRTADCLAASGYCNAVQISLDGIGQVHESTRGAGTFAPALRAITLLRERGISVAVRVTITRLNLGTLADTAKVLLEELNLPSFSTNSALTVGSCAAASDALELRAQDFAASMQEHRELLKRYPGRIKAASGPLAALKNWSRMLRDRREGRPPESGCGFLSSCGGVFQTLGVLADGTYVPCIQLPHLHLGRINRERLAEIWTQAPPLAALRNSRTRSLKELPYCRDCEWNDACRGGCPAERPDLQIEPPLRSCYRRFHRSVADFQFFNTDCEL